MTADEFDVVVVGAGPAGENVAGRVADGGLSVAIVERELVGGECSYWGCIPSKALLRPGDVVAAARRVAGVSAAVTDVAAALARRDWMTSDWTDGGAVPWLDSKGITLVRGSARVTGDRTLDVDGRGLVARRAVVLATGTLASMPPIPGLADAHPWDNRSATAAKEVPRRLLVLGGGAIGVELAQAFRRLGSDDVTIVEAAPRLLGREEPFAGEEVAGALRAEGVTVLTGVSMASVRRKGRDGPVSAVLGDGRELEADELLVAVGRRPATADLGLERAGLEPGRYVEVDDTMRSTSVPWLFAVGDCNGRSLLTHMGKYQARIAADVILGKPARASGPVPRVTFTDPQVAAVGLTEAEAREQLGDARVRTVRQDMASVAAATTLGDGVGGTGLLVVDDDRRVVVGATFTGPNVADLLHSATIAVAAEVPLDRLWHAVPSFPTLSEVWLRLLEAYGL